jgi:hypothetical protein
MKRPNKPPDVFHYNGVKYQLPEELKVNESFFVPTLRPKGVYTRIVRHYRGCGYKLVWVERIERGLLGIRVWRVV